MIHWQELLTYIFIAYAIGYTIYHMAKMLIPQKSGNMRKPHKCSGCSGCEIKDVQTKFNKQSQLKIQSCS